MTLIAGYFYRSVGSAPVVCPSRLVYVFILTQALLCGLNVFYTLAYKKLQLCSINYRYILCSVGEQIKLERIRPGKFNVRSDNADYMASKVKL